LNVGRYIHTATLLPNGKVLVVGGKDPASKTICTPELFDPLSGNWTTNNAGPLVVRRYSHTATLLPGGKVLVAGGAVRDSVAPASPISQVEQYDYPTFGSWTSTGS